MFKVKNNKYEYKKLNVLPLSRILLNQNMQYN